ncbi:MAG: penicillin-binding protein 1A [Proteobacteria bacterium]|nr:penicillin-binding protein 1A [Burkholderiales bacterium]
MFKRSLLLILLFIIGVSGLAVLVVAFAAAIAYPKLPSLEVLTDYRPKVPLRVFSAEGDLLGEFGEERRAVVKIEAVPDMMKKAILAAEDDRFYEHGGVDYLGVVRAAISNFSGGGARQGASTITMQVARNFFLSREKTFTRKFHEALLAFKIEASLSKDKIFELYINQIFLGQRAYGFAAAAQTYFGKSLAQLEVAEMAMLAGLPKAPSRFNPVVNPQRAKLRQQYVLRRMNELGYIDAEQLAAAEKFAMPARREGAESTVHADYVAEMVRQVMYERFREEAYTRGLRVHTTVLSEHQLAAYASVRRGVIAYDRRHGFRGPERFVDFPPNFTDEQLEDLLQDDPDSDGLFPAIVLQIDDKSAVVYRRGLGRVTIAPEGLRFAQRAIGDQAPLKQRLRPGAVVRIQRDEKNQWQVTQLPQVEASLVAVSPSDGAIRALIGGFDFNRAQFNHVTQAIRQPGSSFKPFIYSAALERGFTASTVVNDAPLRFGSSQTGSEPWEPKNYDGKYDGPMRIRTALARSKNLVTIRVLQAIGVHYAQDYIAKFGFDPKLHPPYLTMALGAGGVTPMQMAAGYAVFANGGYRVTPFMIQRVEDQKGVVLFEAKPQVAGDTAERAIDGRNAFVMTSLMQDVVKVGTAMRALSLGRADLAGKTGTTNDFLDAWFAGYQSTLVAVSWVGFSTPRTLGNGETGSAAALPIWISYMAVALKGIPEQQPVAPEGVTTARVDSGSGLRDPDGRGVPEFFYHENLPREQEPVVQGTDARPPDDVKAQIF